MSHGLRWRAACSMTIRNPELHFRKCEIARGVTAKDVGSCALFGHDGGKESSEMNRDSHPRRGWNWLVMFVGAVSSHFGCTLRIQSAYSRAGRSNASRRRARSCCSRKALRRSPTSLKNCTHALDLLVATGFRSQLPRRSDCGVSSAASPAK